MTNPSTSIVTAFIAAISMVLAGCEDTVPQSNPHAPPEPEEPAAPSIIPAILGSAERQIGNRYPDAEILVEEKSISNTASQLTICARFIVTKRYSKFERYYAASASDVEIFAGGSPQWKELCADTKPIPFPD